METIRVLSTSSEAFLNRRQAGRLLAGELKEYTDRHAVVLGIPRGGVIVAAPVARELHANLDVVLTRKLGAPCNPELAIGAVAENGPLVVDPAVAALVHASPQYIESVKQLEVAEIARRAAVYRKDHPKVPLEGRIVIVTDDGVATGSTILAALMAARAECPAKLICAVPVAAQDSLTKLSAQADEVVCLRAPPFFDAVGRFYLEFEQTSDQEVLSALKELSPEVTPERQNP